MVIRIYDVRGGLIRELKLGSLPAGIYRDRDGAAYWDGRDTTGEKVSSGVYFYVIQAGEFRAARKMVILK